MLKKYFKRLAEQLMTEDPTYQTINGDIIESKFIYSYKHNGKIYRLMCKNIKATAELAMNHFNHPEDRKYPISITLNDRPIYTERDIHTMCIYLNSHPDINILDIFKSIFKNLLDKINGN